MPEVLASPEGECEMKSNCCNAPVHVSYGNDNTNCYMCDQCGKPCDMRPEHIGDVNEMIQMVDLVEETAKQLLLMYGDSESQIWRDFADDARSILDFLASHGVVRLDHDLANRRVAELEQEKLLSQANEATARDIDCLRLQLKASEEVRQNLAREVAEYGDRACNAEREMDFLLQDRNGWIEKYQADIDLGNMRITELEQQLASTFKPDYTITKEELLSSQNPELQDRIAELEQQLADCNARWCRDVTSLQTALFDARDKLRSNRE